MKRFWRAASARSGDGKKLSAGGFTRLDLLVAAGVLSVLALWMFYSLVGERGRTVRCAWNLGALGKAMHRYANEHGESLPPAGVNVGKYQSSWDLQTFSYLKPGLSKENNEKLAATVPRFFACPSDKNSHSGTTRSYAMSSNDMTLQNWPPGKESATGLGLNWDVQSVSLLLNDEALKQPESLPGMKLSDIPAPADTVLLTELIAPGNFMGSYQMASMSGSARQTQSLPNGGAGFHLGKLNYLMADGHRELLSPLQTGAIDGTAGIWSMKKGN